MLLKKSDLNQALEILAADASVFVPGEVEGVKRFRLWEDGMEIHLTGENTALPPKDILFPCTEKMYNYKMGPNIEIKEVVENPHQVIFGIRPCDMRSIDCMDHVFLEKGYVDSFYSRKRENVLLFAIGCTSVARTCFCDSMGLNPNDAPNADVMMHDAGDSLVMEAYTQKGSEALNRLSGLLSEGGEAKKDTACELKVNMTEDMPSKLGKMFEHPIWDEVTRACVGCATCTYVCPTCYCFDIDSDNHGEEGTKYRCWDSCMFSDYSRMAGGHNPRPTKKERVRNRYLHKLSFFHDRYGQLLCVGCGRCVEKCPAHMDITTFIDKAAEVEI
jgi:ferredoxin